MSPTVRMLAKDSPGTAVAKYLTCQAESRGSEGEARRLAEEHCRQHPHIAETLRFKTAVGGGTTTSGGGPLSEYGLAAEAFTIGYAGSAIAEATPLCRVVPFNTAFSAEGDAGAAASWVGEGLPIPNAKLAFSQLTQRFYKVLALAVVSRELFKFNPTTEAALLAVLRRLYTRFLNGQLLDPAVAGTSAHPPSLTFGATAVTSAGTTAANIITDVTALGAAIGTAFLAPALFMRPSTYYAAVGKLAGVGIQATKADFLGYRVIFADGGPQQIALVDLYQVALSTDPEATTLDATSEADIEMSDAPSQDGTTGGGHTQVSLYQNNLVALRLGLTVCLQHCEFLPGSPAQPAGAAVCAVTY